MKPLDYEKDTQIDETSLDIEILEQPGLMLKYSKHEANVLREEDDKKDEVELVKAEIEKEIRDDPDKFDIPKITEAAVKAAILMDRRYKKVIKEYNDAKYNSRIAKGAVKSIDARKHSLSDMVQLYIGQYFAGPKIPRNLTEQRKIKQEQVDSNISEKLNKRTRRK